MEPKASLPHSQQPVLYPYPEPDRSSPCPHPSSQRSILYYSLTYAWVFHVVSFPQVSSPKPCMRLSFPHTCYVPCPSQSSWLDHPNDIWWRAQHESPRYVSAWLFLLFIGLTSVSFCQMSQCVCVTLLLQTYTCLHVCAGITNGSVPCCSPTVSVSCLAPCCVCVSMSLPLSCHPRGPLWEAWNAVQC